MKNPVKFLSWKNALLNLTLTYDEETDSIEFLHEGLTFVVPLEGDDAQFGILVLPNIWPLHDDRMRSIACQVASQVNSEVKVAKVFVNPDGQNVSVACEFFLPSLDMVAGIVHRLLEASIFARHHFGDSMQIVLNRMQAAVAAAEARGAPPPPGPAPLAIIWPFGKNDPKKPN
ncbi:MAG: hypothetical protein IT477_10655 [Rhodanobacteraceae bacterium]|nr:hypothetical protein [Rhodanobacteraceae bacterium]